MLNSKDLTIVKDFGDKTEFTIARFRCILQTCSLVNKQAVVDLQSERKSVMYICTMYRETLNRKLYSFRKSLI